MRTAVSRLPELAVPRSGRKRKEGKRIAVIRALAADSSAIAMASTGIGIVR
jgi:hypothetical protein